VKKRLRAIEKGLTCFVDTTDARTAHRLRIQAKKLRYLAELLEPVWPDKIPALLQALVPLQETFGELHDADVRIAEFIARAGLEKHADPHAVAWLNQVEDERAMLAEKGLALAHRWRSESLGRDLRQLFRKPALVSV
jgi:CHAD domain-containing protein